MIANVERQELYSDSMHIKSEAAHAFSLAVEEVIIELVAENFDSPISNLKSQKRF